MTDAWSENRRAAPVSVMILGAALLAWELAIPAQQVATEMTEYERLMGAGQARAGISRAVSGGGQGVGTPARPAL